MEHRKFLVLRFGAVGDVIRTLPAVKALKDYYPSSHIAWVVEEPSKALLETQPEIDEVILFPRKSWTDGMRSSSKMWNTAGEALEFITDLRKREFDTVLDFHGILKSGLISFFSGAPKRIGFDRISSKEGNFLFSNVKVRLQEERMSRYQRNFSLLRGIGLEVNLSTSRPEGRDLLEVHPEPHFVLPPSKTRLRVAERVNGFRHSLHIPQKDQEYIESFFNGLSILSKRPLIAIHPGTSPKTFYKRWMPNQYSQLADRLIRELRASVIFTWGPEELKSVEGIQKEMKEISILGPKTESLTQLGEVYRRCDLYVGGDTGPMHIASLMGIPVVVIYGPTDPIVNEPLGQHRKVRKEVGCNPCRNRSCKELTCLKVITVEDVFQATKEICNTSPL